MVTSVSQTPQTTKTSIFYVNDVHGQALNLERLKNASTEFDNTTGVGDKLKLSAGDFCLGMGIPLNKLAIFAQNALGIAATAGGNHEFDMDKKDLVNVLKNSNYKILGLNVVIPEDTAENKTIHDKVTKSYIQEQNGTKYGVIGLFPYDFAFHVTKPEEYSDFKILSMEETIPLVQKEIDNLKDQGVNKIILLSHTGYVEDVKMAKSVEGIDVILGGHSHDLIKGIEEGKNLFYSTKTGNPTIITQAGKDGRYFGVLNLEFNDDGVITKAQNNVSRTDNYPRNAVMEYFANKFLGEPVVVGKIASVPKYSFSLLNENPNADFVTDAIRDSLNVDIGLINPANLRASFEKGDLTDRYLSNLTPFKNDMCIFDVTEKELVDAIKIGGKSMNEPDGVPGLIQLSGVKYVVTKTGEVKSVTFVDKNGEEREIDINNPNPFKTYSVGADFYVAKGGNGYMTTNKWDVAKEKFNFDKDKLVIDYIKKLNTPVDIKTDGRIQIVD